METLTQITKTAENEFRVVQFELTSGGNHQNNSFPSPMTESSLEEWLYTRRIFDSDPSGWHKIKALNDGETVQVGLHY
jgi:hypothetical protein